MKNAILILLLSLVLSGCATARLSKGPDPSALIQYEHSIPVGVAKAADLREREKVGTIGALSIFVRKNDLTDLVGNYLIQYLNRKVGLNVERVHVSEINSIKLIAVKNQVDRVILLRIKELKMFSLDALLEPVRVDMALELMVFDEAGDEIYRRTVTGHYEKRIGVSIVEKSTGELVESVVKAALSQYGKDPDLKRIIAKFKHGAIGGAIAHIF